MREQNSQTKVLLKRCARILVNENRALFKTGGSYNLFDFLVSGDEELIHSSIIASMLNPKGRHLQGPLFLKLFLAECGITEEFDADSAYVTCEKGLGIKVGSGEEASGGRIDIYLEDKFKHRIIIENKWNAGDQPDQLIRYHNYAPDSIILYLTRFGHLPSKCSVGASMKEGKDFHCISYKKEISSWLLNCTNAIRGKAYISVALDSYRKLINRLNMTGEDNKILEEIKSSKDTINAAFKISKALGELKKNGQIFFWTELFNKLRDGAGLNPEICTNFDKKVKQNIEDIVPAIQLYVNKDASNKNVRYYGIRCLIGDYLGEKVFAAILVNTNIYFPVFAPGKKEFNRKAYEFFKEDSTWNHSDFENIAWKRPGNNEKFDFRNFDNEDVYSLALGDITLVNHIYDEFLETVRIARHNLDCLVKENNYQQTRQ